MFIYINDCRSMIIVPTFINIPTIVRISETGSTYVMFVN
jgi:hypothetical protein